ncbi:sulfotransferase family 5A, member 1 isoform X2 [Cetorhinus maximus]
MANLDVTLRYSGINFPGHLHSMQSMQFAEGFKFHDSDTLIVTYPKSGTTWMQEILTLIYSDGNQEPAKTIPNWIRTPWIEHYYCEDILLGKADHRIITTHLPYHILSKSLKQSNTKVIYVARNPMDIIVSFYHFHKMANFLPDPVHFGSWFEHIKDWLSHREEFNFFFITYEELKKDLRHSVEKLCNFLERSLLPETIDAIVRHCNFTAMKDNQMINYTLIPNEIMDHQRGKFMRKGAVGDWKEHFTDEQKQLFEKIFQDKMRDFKFRFIWTL